MKVKQSKKSAKGTTKYGPTKNHVGRRIGSYKVLKIAGQNERGQYYYWCRCDCGTIKKVRAGNLNSGRYLSCGQCQTNLTMDAMPPLDLLLESATITAEVSLHGDKEPSSLTGQLKCGMKKD